MGCVHCDIRESGIYDLRWSRGLPFWIPGLWRDAYIEPDAEYGFVLVSTNREYDEVEETSIPISHCPWCGRKLGNAFESLCDRCEFDDDDVCGKCSVYLVMKGDDDVEGGRQ